MAVDRSQIPAWVGKYVGIPWKVHGRGYDGADCWGLFRLVLANEFGVVVAAFTAAYDGANREDVADIARLIEGHRIDWTAIPLGIERAGDGLLIRQHGHACHVGIVVALGWMLHIEEGIDAVVDAYDGPVWRRRVVGVYRHALLA